MRNAIVQLCLVIIGVLSVHAARLLATSSFMVRVDPVAATSRVLAIKGRDSLPMSRIGETYYAEGIEPGRWEILIEANSSYKNEHRELTVGPGSHIDLGEIKMVRQ